VIPLARPEIRDEDIEAVVQVLRTGHLVQGARVAEFEAAIAEYTGGGEIVAVSNCTAGLQLSLLALGIGPGHQVGVATFSWPATANAIEQCGATPIFVDIEPVTLGMAPDMLARTLAEGPRLSALIVVHAFGSMANMPAIRALADAAGVPVIEDAACALGATLDGTPAGAWGKIGCYSFHPRKAATTGEGGAIRTSDVHLARRLRGLRNHGIDPDSRPNDFVAAGFNMRLTEFQAALGTSQLSRYRALVDGRRTSARQYDALLNEMPVNLPQMLDASSHIYQSYVIQVNDCDEIRRNNVIAALKTQGIETNIGTHHMPLLRFFRQKYGYAAGDFPVTDRVAASSLALPLYSGLRAEQQRDVVTALNRELMRRA
jgi:perosamine synthetase